MKIKRWLEWIVFFFTGSGTIANEARKDGIIK